MEWISVKERLPNKTSWVLVCADGAINCMAWNAEKRQWEDWTLPQAPNVIIPFITHWAEIEPPKEE